MKVKWLICDIIGDDITNLLGSLERSGTEYKKISKAYDVDLNSLFHKDDCVVYYGSLGVGYQVRRHTPWLPGIYSTTENYECAKYYPLFGDFLLNRNYMMIPFGDLSRQKEFLYERMGQQDAIFIRPNSGNKTFTGKLVYKEHFDKDISYMGYNQINHYDLVVVAEPRNVLREWRFVVVDDKIIAGSLYVDRFKFNNKPGSGNNLTELNREEDVFLHDVPFTENEHVRALAFAEQVLDNVEYSPDRAWTLDICEDKFENLHVLEVGCFSCAGLYCCNTDTIVKEINRIALEDWKNYYKDSQ